ncbi:MAG: hypothetical protein AB8G96_04050 [Phycisphaerales bacterium]
MPQFERDRVKHVVTRMLSGVWPARQRRAAAGASWFAGPSAASVVAASAVAMAVLVADGGVSATTSMPLDGSRYAVSPAYARTIGQLDLHNPRSSAVVDLRGAPALRVPDARISRPTDLVRVSSSPMMMRDVIDLIDLSWSGPLLIEWRALTAIGLGPDELVDLPVGDVSVERICRAVEDRADDESVREPVAWFLDLGTLTLTTQPAMDRRTEMVVVHDLRQLLDVATGGDDNGWRLDVVEDLVAVLSETVEPEAWVDNGGELASFMLFGDLMFITAPLRMQREITWVLDRAHASVGLTDQVRRSRPVDPLLLDRVRRGENLEAATGG